MNYTNLKPWSVSTPTMAKNTTREKKLQKRMYAIIAGLVIINLLYNYFFEPKIIGHNIKYTIYFFGVPVILGIIFFGYFRRTFLAKMYGECTTLADKIFISIFYFLQGLLFSYLSFGLIGDLTWAQLNKNVAQKNQTIIITCNVNKLREGYRSSSPKIYFTYQDRSENFTITEKTFMEYKASNAKDYELEIEGRKGLWNYFVAENWAIINKRK